MPQRLALPHRRESALPYAFAFENIGYGRILGAVRVLCVTISLFCTFWLIQVGLRQLRYRTAQGGTGPALGWSRTYLRVGLVLL